MMSGNMIFSSLDKPDIYLSRIKHLIFRTQEGRREMIVWLSQEIPAEALSGMRLFAAADDDGSVAEYSLAESGAEDFIGETSIFYVLPLEPAGSYGVPDEVIGRLHSINVPYIEINLANGEEAGFIHNPKNGFFYPCEKPMVSSAEGGEYGAN